MDPTNMNNDDHHPKNATYWKAQARRIAEERDRLQRIIDSRPAGFVMPNAGVTDLPPAQTVELPPAQTVELPPKPAGGRSELT